MCDYLLSLQPTGGGADALSPDIAAKVWNANDGLRRLSEG